MSSLLFDDDFAEASIEAISLAAINTTSPPLVTSNPVRSQPNAQSILASANLPLHTDKLPHNKHPSLWAHHIFSLPHNALRAEFKDLGLLLYALPPHGPPVQLLSWFPPFTCLLSDYLAFESDVLLPWVYAGCQEPGRLAFRAEQKTASQAVQDAMEELSTTLTLYRTQPPHHVTPLLIRAVKVATHAVLLYLDNQERVLPSLVASTRTREEALNVERLMVRRLDVGLLTRWVPRGDRTALRMRLLTPWAWLTWLGTGRRALADHLRCVHRPPSSETESTITNAANADQLTVA